jgi:3-hydroxyacyl-CoA dehydrogenase
MLYADQFGLFNVVQAMKRFQKNPLDDAKFWEPAPLLAKLAAESKTFN